MEELELVSQPLFLYFSWALIMTNKGDKKLNHPILNISIELTHHVHGAMFTKYPLLFTLLTTMARMHLSSYKFDTYLIRLGV